MPVFPFCTLVTGTFYAKNFGVYSKCATNEICTYNGKILHQLNFLAFISRILPPPLLWYRYK